MPGTHTQEISVLLGLYSAITLNCGHAVWPVRIVNEPCGGASGEKPARRERSFLCSFFGTRDFARVSLKEVIPFGAGVYYSFDLKCKQTSFIRSLDEVKLWNDSFKYDKTTKIGGPNGSIRFEEVDRNGYNTELKTAIDLLEPIKEEHRRITYADLYQLAGFVAIEVTGGPSIDFSPGRWDSSVCPKEGRLPIAKQGSVTLRDIFYPLGLSDKDIVALSAVHCLVKARVPKFDNSYFIELLRRDSLGILKKHTEKVLAEDPVFRSYIELYAKDNEVFFRDYAESQKKLSEVGFVPPSISKGAKGDVGFTLLAQSVVGVAVAAVMVFLRHVYVISRKKECPFRTEFLNYII